MMGQSSEAASGPDFAAGIARDAIPEEGTLAGRVGDEPVLLSRLGGAFHAIGATCTHYGGPLGEGLAEGGVVRCPWHHACFDLRTGEALRAPAIPPVDRWRVEEEGATVFVREKLDPADVRKAAPADVRDVVIVGGGAAGFACAEMLRRRGYAGTITMLSADADAPYDRPNLSKDFLAGNAPDEWMPLKPDDFYTDNAIDLRLGVEVTAIDAEARRVTTAAGESFRFDRLLLATGAEPVRPPIPGFDRPEALLLRSFADARAIAARARKGMRAVVFGSGFIGMEAAAALSARGLSVTVVSLDEVPMVRQFGSEVGGLLRRRHEKEGIAFRLGRTATRYEGERLVLDDGESVDADFVLIGLGVRPRVALAEAAGLAVD
jgi:nitrite reductase/ring-hydroxylating ferredoxin subunit/thioredoxin reductase